MALIDEYDEAAEALRLKTAIFLDEEKQREASDDFHLQVLQDCSQVCDIYDVPKADRADLICDCIRQQAYEEIDQEIDNFRWQMQVMGDL